ncbi:NUDIX domain-containing protein [Nonomuraea sp. NPDC055795]
MATRIDYFDDPNAPRANSLVPSVNVIVTNDAGELLMVRRSDNGNWAVPGGAIDLGESIPAAAIRETLEETGITCEITGLSGTYSDPRHVILYTSNGEARQEFSLVLMGRAVSGTLTPSRESSQVRWVASEQALTLPMDRSMRMRIEHYFLDMPSPHIG